MRPLRDALKRLQGRIGDTDAYFNELQRIIQSSGDRWNHLVKKALDSQRSELPAPPAEPATIMMPI